MAYDREEDILYLAHQLWEEDEAPVSDAHSYWQRAATQVLAQGRSFARRAYDATPESFSPSRATSVSSHVIARMRLQFGTSGLAEMDRVSGPRSVTSIRRAACPRAANQSMGLIRKID